AAGEVVERPASIVKELVENSLDAGATQITIEVQGGGVSLIRVADNGIGIPPAEVELAFHRHATSKISTPADLQGIATLGFRGEALPSITAVAQVDMLSCTEAELAGSYLGLRDGRVVEKRSQGCPPGTTVTVRNLFRHIPARLKFLKSPTTENNHVTNLVSQFGLAFPEVRFSLAIDGRALLHTPGNGNLRDTVSEVYGPDVAQAMLDVRSQEGRGEASRAAAWYPQVMGLASPPSLGRASRSRLSLFVNRRWVQSRPLARAVEEAYGGLLMTGRHPTAVINVALAPQDIDVNVHPAKTEVRFRYEQAVFSSVYQAVRLALARLTPPILKPHPSSASELLARPPKEKGQTELDLVPPPTEEAPPRSLPVLRVLGQLANVYIIAEGPDGLYLIDQHAAHERILFEKVLGQRARRSTEAQGLLEPVTIEVGAGQRELLEAKGESLAQFGFAIEPFGQRTYLVRTVPSILKGRDVAEVVGEVLDLLAGDASTDWEEKTAISIACHSAVRAGQVLSPEEMRELVLQLEETHMPQTCPHGRPTMIHLSSGQLEKEFGRS
ncbi:DNA mismatch repair endonuclease MutL, partial [Chloroflexota bacterium]